jgi:hypothetical protein
MTHVMVTINGEESGVQVNSAMQMTVEQLSDPETRHEMLRQMAEAFLSEAARFVPE